MMIIIKIILFLLGMSLCVQVVAACYGIIDHWYMIQSAYPKVIGNILIRGAITIIIALLIGDAYRASFLWGLAAFLVVHVGTFCGYKVLLKVQ